MVRRGKDETTIIQIPGAAGRQAHRKLRLEVIAGVDAGLRATVESRIAHIGTAEGNQLRLTDSTVSRIHLEIKNTRSGLLLRDLGSTNGTWLEAVRIVEAIVPYNIAVSVGKCQVRIEALDEQVSELLSSSDRFGSLYGQSEAMRALFGLLERVAPTDETVLIVGETGTGKEVCARSIVEASRRRQKPLVTVDCGAIPPTLLESELFGHARGSFTGAVAEHTGAFERAQGGTVFLDEIGELPLELQTRLLRAVENRQIRRVGDGREIPLDIRILAATNRRLEEEVNRGTFRADLYYRLSVVQIPLPPLRERPEDVELLARHFLAELGAAGSGLTLSEPQLADLKRQLWPGNVRELRNHLRRMALGEPAFHGLAVGGLGVGGPAASVDPGPGAGTIDLSLPFREHKARATEQFERRYLEVLMREATGNISKAARIAQTDRTYLSRMLDKYGLKGE
jgi:transcriptional regulator with GAF, ATPase, and Fis domain